MEIEKLIDQISDDIYKKMQNENTVNTAEKISSCRKNDASLAGMIDHTLLKPEASAEQVTKLCKEAAKFNFASVCVNTCYVPLAAKILGGTGVNVCCVVGFPLGAMATKSKAVEAMEAAANGSSEIDMVINIGAIKSNDWKYVKNDISEVVKASAKFGAIVKVIIEACLLNNDEKVKACLAAKEAGAAFVKTSTGFSTGGANTEDVSLMRKTVGPDMGVKAAGGIRNYEDAVKMVHAGASRIGTSHGVEIIESENMNACGETAFDCKVKNYPGSNMKL